MDDTRAAIIVEGDRALFSRPEFRRDLVSYDVITPSAARGVLDKVHWRPAIRWIVDAITVLNPIEFDDMIIPGARAADQRASILRNVRYQIDAHFIMTDEAASPDEVAQHRSMFRRRAKRGVDVFLGRPDFTARVGLTDLQARPGIATPLNRDLGWMLHDADHADHGRLRFFRAVAVGGVIAVPAPGSDLLRG